MAHFEQYNDQGALQFSTDTYAYYFVEKITIPMSDTLQEPYPYYGTYGSYTSLSNPNPDLLFVRPIGGPVVPLTFMDTYNGVTKVSIKGAAPYRSDTPFGYGQGPTSAEIYAFKSMKLLSPSAHGVGLELYDAQGNVCYSVTENRVPLRVLRADPITSMGSNAASYSGWNPNFSLPSGRDYAFMLCGTARYAATVQLDNGSFYPWLPGVHRTGTGYTMTKIMHPDMENTTKFAGASMLIADVTDY